MSLHESDVLSRLTRFLGRKQMPRRLEGRPTAEADEVTALVSAVNRNAPRGADALAQWWPAFEARLGEICGGMWPTEKEIIDAARHASKARGEAAASGDDAIFEAAAIERMIDWFEKFKGQLPGHGSPARTAELIKRGVLANEREANFRGFDLGPNQRARASEQRMGRDEWRNHIAIYARLRGTSLDEAEAYIRATAKDPVTMAQIPDKSFKPDWGDAA